VLGLKINDTLYGLRSKILGIPQKIVLKELKESRSILNLK
jgi:hypothetical protein